MTVPPAERAAGPRATMRVRLLQTAPVLGDVDGNLAAQEARVAEASGCDLVVAPELASHGYHLSELPDVTGLDPHDPRLVALGRHGPAVVTGFAEAWRHHMFNSAALVMADDIAIQRKMYLPTYRSWEERKHFRPGGRLRTYDLGDTRIATLVCNDLWQAPIPWLAAHNGAEVIVVIASSSISVIGIPTERAWEILLLHTAVSLQSYVVFVNRSGLECGRDFWGGSRVISPWGTVLTHMGREPGEVDCDLDFDELRRLRRECPLLQESRADVIAREAGLLAAEEM